jgi:hypothetical protein
MLRAFSTSGDCVQAECECVSMTEEENAIKSTMQALSESAIASMSSVNSPAPTLQPVTTNNAPAKKGWIAIAVVAALAAAL